MDKMLVQFSICIYAVVLVWCMHDAKAIVDDSVMRNLEHACPNIKFCSQNMPTEKKAIGKSCCSTCMCTDECQFYGRCCPNYIAENKTKVVPSLECYAPVLNIKVNAFITFSMGIAMYNVFTRCPSKSLEFEEVKRCERAPSSLEEFLMVSDKHGVVYKNEFCASCYGVDNFLKWNVAVQKSNSFDVMRTLFELSQNFSNVQSLRAVWQEPPNPEIGKRSICYPAYEKCNVTGQWSKYDITIEQACLSYTLYYIYPSIRNGKLVDIEIFKNVHCFYCNKRPELQSDQQTCSILRGMSDMSRLTGVIPFTAVLNSKTLSYYNGTQIMSVQNRCKRSQQYDPYFDMCRELICPMTYIPNNGKCYPAFSKTFGYSIALMLRLSPAQPKRNISDNIKNDVWLFENFELKETLDSWTDFEKFGCSFCQLILGESRDNIDKHLLAMLIYHTNKDCSIEELNAHMLGIKEKTSETAVVQFEHIGIKYNLSYAGGDFTHVKWYDLKVKYRIYDAFSNRVCRGFIFFKDRLVCPHISLNVQEFHTVANDTSLNTNISNIPYLKRKSLRDSTVTENSDLGDTNGELDEYVNYEYDICVDDYLDVIGGTNVLFIQPYMVYGVSLFTVFVYVVL